MKYEDFGATVGSIWGASLGSSAGMTAGSAIGALFGGIGAIPGGIIGGFIGGVIGLGIGLEIGRKIGRHFDEANIKKAAIEDKIKKLEQELALKYKIMKLPRVQSREHGNYIENQKYHARQNIIDNLDSATESEFMIAYFNKLLKDVRIYRQKKYFEELRDYNLVSGFERMKVKRYKRKWFSKDECRSKEVKLTDDIKTQIEEEYLRAKAKLVNYRYNQKYGFFGSGGKLRQFLRKVKIGLAIPDRADRERRYEAVTVKYEDSVARIRKDVNTCRAAEEHLLAISTPSLSTANTPYSDIENVLKELSSNGPTTNNYYISKSKDIKGIKDIKDIVEGTAALSGYQRRYITRKDSIFQENTHFRKVYTYENRVPFFKTVQSLFSAEIVNVATNIESEFKKDPQMESFVTRKFLTPYC